MGIARGVPAEIARIELLEGKNETSLMTRLKQVSN